MRAGPPGNWRLSSDCLTGDPQGVARASMPPLTGAVTEDRGPIHHPRMRQEVYSRVVRAEAIIPERDVTKFPTPPNRELGLGHMFEQERQQGVALLGSDLEYTPGEAGIDE